MTYGRHLWPPPQQNQGVCSSFRNILVGQLFGRTVSMPRESPYGKDRPLQDDLSFPLGRRREKTSIPRPCIRKHLSPPPRPSRAAGSNTNTRAVPGRPRRRAGCRVRCRAQYQRSGHTPIMRRHEAGVDDRMHGESLIHPCGWYHHRWAATGSTETCLRSPGSC